jgi:acylpyruvate hydrolase
MRLATVRVPGGTRAVKLVGFGGETHLVDLGAADLGAFLRDPNWRARAETADEPVPSVHAPFDYAPLVPAPSKIVCVGHNYRNHIREMGRDLPTHPTLFAKYADSLIGADDVIVKPAESDAFDWEVELAVVIGSPVRRPTPQQAADAIAGFTVMNDVTARDWQSRTLQWLQGKMWDSSTPVGPQLVTPDELPGGVRPSLQVRLTVDGQVMQQDSTGDLLFDPVALVEYVGTIIRLNAGDLIATGTPAGVGHARDPKRYLRGGETVIAEVEGLGTCTNRVVENT